MAEGIFFMFRNTFIKIETMEDGDEIYKVLIVVCSNDPSSLTELYFKCKGEDPKVCALIIPERIYNKSNLKYDILEPSHDYMDLDDNFKCYYFGTRENEEIKY